MSPEELFRDNLPLIERVIAGICRRSGLRDADAEDFGSIVKLELIDNDYAILRGYEGRAPLGAFLAVVVQRMLSREWVRLRGRWHPSAEAERNGETAVLIEKLTVHDGRPLDEAIEIACNVDPSLDRARARAIAGQLPPRTPRLRLVPMPEEEPQFVAPEAADARAHESDALRFSKRAAAVVRETLASLALVDRMLIRLCFGAQMSVADAARVLAVPQRPLYRRLEALIRQLRGALERAGIDSAVVESVISAGVSEFFDFGLADGKNEQSHPTSVAEDDIDLPD